MNFIERSSLSTTHSKHFALFNEQRETGELCDIAIIVNEGKINAHKLILSCGSPLLREMLTTSTEAKMEKIHLPDISYETMEQIVDFIYTGKTSISSENSQNLLTAANYLQMKELISLGGRYIFNQIDDQNCFSLKNFLKKTTCEEFSKRAQNYINVNFTRLTKNQSFVQLNINDIAELLTSDEIHNVSEEDVYYGAIGWLNAQIDPKKHAERILQCIRLSLLSDTFKSEIVFENSLFSKDTIENLVFSDKPRILKSVIVALHDPHTLWSYDGTAKHWTKFLDLDKLYSEVFANKDELIFATIWSREEYIFDVFNLKTKQWRRLPNLPYRNNRMYCTVLIAVGKIYVFSYFYRNWTVDAFDFTTNTWSEMSVLDDDYEFLHPVAIENQIYIFATSDDEMRKLTRLDTTTHTSVDLPKMTIERYLFGLTAYKGKIYVAGGYVLISEYQKRWRRSVEVYDPATNEWKELSPMVSENMHTKLITTTDGIFAIRSNESSGELIVEYYDVEEDTWSIESDIEAKCYSACTIPKFHQQQIKKD